MQREAHKRGTFALGAPSMTWHLGYLVEDAERVYSSAEGRQEKDAQSEATIEHYAAQMFVSLLEAIQKNASSLTAGTLIQQQLERARRSGTKSVFLSVDGVLVKVIVSDHSDHFTVTVVVDLSKPGQLQGDPEDESVIWIDGVCSGFQERVTAHYLNYANHVTGKSDPARSFEDDLAAVQYLKDGIWDDVFMMLFAGSAMDCSHWPVKSETIPEIFADFRGVFVNSKDMQWHQGKGVKPPPTKLVGKEAPYQQDSEKNEGLLALLPFFSIEDENLKYRELVACTMFRNRAVYLSPLGATPFNAAIERMQEGIRPLHFCIAVAENNRWQIGRIIRRINNMGCMRLLAVRDLDKVKQASDEIRSVGKRMDDEFLNLTTEVKDVERDIDNDRHRLSAFKTEIDKIGTDIAGHLPYRIYRAKFRSDQFRRQVDDLFVERIEGWQPYDEFVRRRLYPTYRFIARVGERYDRLNKSYQAQLHSLDIEMQSVSSTNLVEIQHDILESHSFQHLIETIALAYYGGYITLFVSKPHVKTFGKWLKSAPEGAKVDKTSWAYKSGNWIYEAVSDADFYKMLVFSASTVIAVTRWIYKERQHRLKVEANRPAYKAAH